MDKIICIGKNYPEHAEELGEKNPEMPVLFLKPPSVAVSATEGAMVHVPLPRGKGAIHHECELVLKLGTAGRILAVTVGLDMTLRDLQTKLKKEGHPWEVSKVFRGAAVFGPWISLDKAPNYLDTEFSLVIDGQIKQKGRGSQMSLTPEKCVWHAKEYFPICEGDLLFTGTPAGVGPVFPGNRGELRWGEKVLYRVEFA